MDLREASHAEIMLMLHRTAAMSDSLNSQCVAC